MITLDILKLKQIEWDYIAILNMVLKLLKALTRHIMLTVTVGDIGVQIEGMVVVVTLASDFIQISLCLHILLALELDTSQIDVVAVALTAA